MLNYLLYICLIIACVKCVHYQYSKDYVNRQDKLKMIRIAYELMKEATLIVRQVAQIRDEHSGCKAFDVGLIMGNIREKYRKMMELYRELNDKDTGRSLFIPPSIWDLRAIHYIVGMENVRALELDIEKLVHVFQVIETEEYNPDPRYTTTTTTSTQANVLRAGNDKDSEEEAVDRIAKEERLKSKYREEQLMRRLGSTGHTKRPRFQHQWPVENAWRMGLYGDMGYGEQ